MLKDFFLNEVKSAINKAIVDSKLGQTNKNIANAFNEINMLPYANKVVILFDEIVEIACFTIINPTYSCYCVNFAQFNPQVVDKSHKFYFFNKFFLTIACG